MDGEHAKRARLELLSGPDCPSCDAVYQRLRKRLATQPELPVMLEQSDILDDLDRAVALGVLRTPALILDGRLIAQGAGFDLEEIFATVRQNANR